VAAPKWTSQSNLLEYQKNRGKKRAVAEKEIRQKQIGREEEVFGGEKKKTLGRAKEDFHQRSARRRWLK